MAIKARILKNRAISAKSLDGAMSRAEYYRMKCPEQGTHAALMRKKDVFREEGQEIFKDGRFDSRTFREVRKSNHYPVEVS